MRSNASVVLFASVASGKLLEAYVLSSVKYRGSSAGSILPDL